MSQVVRKLPTPLPSPNSQLARQPSSAGSYSRGLVSPGAPLPDRARQAPCCTTPTPCPAFPSQGHQRLPTPDLTGATSPALSHCPHHTLSTGQLLLVAWCPRNLRNLPTERWDHRWPDTIGQQSHSQELEGPSLALPQAAALEAAVWLLHLSLP